MDQPAARVAYEFGDFCVDATQRLLRSRIDGEPIPLTSKAVWPNVVVEEKNLSIEAAIAAGREALEMRASHPQRQDNYCSCRRGREEST